jgi:hypothetical protein
MAKSNPCQAVLDFYKNRPNVVTSTSSETIFGDEHMIALQNHVVYCTKGLLFSNISLYRIEYGKPVLLVRRNGIIQSKLTKDEVVLKNIFDRQSHLKLPQ